MAPTQATPPRHAPPHGLPAPCPAGPPCGAPSQGRNSAPDPAAPPHPQPGGLAVTATATAPTAPGEFPFPFTPYPIQLGFMQALWECIDAGRIGIFESPTGTGKTQSILNGSLEWLRGQGGVAEEILRRSEAGSGGNNTGPPDTPTPTPAALPGWVAEDSRKRKREDAEALVAALQRKRMRAASRALRHEQQQQRKRGPTGLAVGLPGEAAGVGSSRGGGGGVALLPSEDTLVLEDPEEWCPEASPGATSRAALAQSLAYVQDSGSDSDSVDLGAFAGGEDVKGRPRIYFCSRTHTQLSQLVEELKKTVWWRDQRGGGGGEGGGFAVRAMQLTSRQHVCLNEEIRKRSRGSGDRLNDLCKESACEYKSGPGVAKMVDRLRVRNIDIEDLVEEGGRVGAKACPYYVARKAAALTELDGFPATIIAVPYAAILTEPARQAFEIDLKDSVVIIDEAHNLISAVNDAHSVKLSLGVLSHTVRAVQGYSARYCNKLHVKNKVKLRQLLAVLKGIEAFLREQGGVAAAAPAAPTPPPAAPRRPVPFVPGGRQAPAQHRPPQKQQQQQQIISPTEFSFASGIEGINVLDLTRFVRESRLFQKLQGFVEKQHQEAEKDASAQAASQGRGTRRTAPAASTTTTTAAVSVSVAQMYAVESFLYKALVGDLQSNRMILARDAADPSLSVVSIHAGSTFADIIRDARSVVLAGGTMSPVLDFISELLPDVPPQRIQSFSCGHVIPPGNLYAAAVQGYPACPHSPNSPTQPYDFRHANRENPAMLAALLHDVARICTATTGGVILFFPSYAYEEAVWRAWDAAGLLPLLSQHREVFREPRRGEGDVAPVLADYQRVCDAAAAPAGGEVGEGGGDQPTPRPALLSSVMGGKLSEGINFADHYGRAVVVVGMPYPNPHDPLLQEKQAFVAERAGRESAARMLDVMCMKAVNQSIGRAFRHQGDYAAIHLMDRRYAAPHILGMIPAWIRGSVSVVPTAAQASQALGAFFASKGEGVPAEAPTGPPNNPAHPDPAVGGVEEAAGCSTTAVGQGS